MQTIIVLASVLACATADVLLVSGDGSQPILARPGEVALTGTGTSIIATGPADGRFKREPEPYYPGYPSGYYPSYYGYGDYAPQDINAMQNSNAYGGYGSNVIAGGNANAYGQRFKREPKPIAWVASGNQGGYGPVKQNSNQMGGSGSYALEHMNDGAFQNRWKRSPQYYGGYHGYPGYGYGGYAPQNVNANQASNAVGGPGSNVVATGTANAGGQRWKRSPQYYGGYPGYPGYGYGGYAPQNINANQASNAVGGAGSTVLASGTANAGGQRWKRSPQYYGGYPGYPGYGYGGYAPQNVNANQASNALGGAGSTVVATGTANASGQRWKRSPQYYGGYPGYPGYGYGGYAPQNINANQASNAYGGPGSTVVSSGTANAGGQRV